MNSSLIPPDLRWGLEVLPAADRRRRPSPRSKTPRPTDPAAGQRCCYSWLFKNGRIGNWGGDGLIWLIWIICVCIYIYTQLYIYIYDYIYVDVRGTKALLKIVTWPTPRSKQKPVDQGNAAPMEHRKIRWPMTSHDGPLQVILGVSLKMRNIAENSVEKSWPAKHPELLTSCNSLGFCWWFWGVDSVHGVVEYCGMLPWNLRNNTDAGHEKNVNT